MKIVLLLFFLLVIAFGFASFKFQIIVMTCIVLRVIVLDRNHHHLTTNVYILRYYLFNNKIIIIFTILGIFNRKKKDPKLVTAYYSHRSAVLMTSF
jgi:hypothetical protein